MPLLYGPAGEVAEEDAEAQALALARIAPSEEAMARHLAQQLAQAETARVAAQREAPAAPRFSRVIDGPTSAIPSSAERAADQIPPDATAPVPRSEEHSESNSTTLLIPKASVGLAGARADAAFKGAPRTSTSTPTPLHTPLPTSTPLTRAAMGTQPHGSVAATSGEPNELIKRQVGRYHVNKRLGRGGMATVYRAHDPQIGRDVAIKFLQGSMCADDESRQRFLREARAAGGLSHPNIVVVLDVGEIENRPYMAMEMIGGAPLSARLEEQGKLPLRDAVLIGVQLARALEYSHGRGVVHRDIKPGNIMLLEDGQTIKVTDFGIAHMDDAPGEPTRMGTLMGTPQYMSPEQTRGEKVDGRSDLFSAGVVLYQMLAGERPFRADSLAALATRIANDEPPPLISKRPDVPAPLRRVVERCLAKTPAQRYQSGKELAEALLRVLAELEEADRDRMRPRTVPLRVKWAATMALVVAVVMGLTAAVITQRQHAALMGQVGDYGASLARFVAAQNAAHVLGEDWAAVDVQVQEIMKSGNFERVSVVDSNGTVRASSQSGLVGQPHRTEGQTLLELRSGDTSATRFASQGQSVLGFETPVLFQGKALGRVALAIPEVPLTQVARLSITLMWVLVVVTVAGVALAMYFLAHWFAKPIRVVREAMAEIGKGRLDHRIAETRNDEFGELFQSFDAMAQALQRREGQSSREDRHQ